MPSLARVVESSFANLRKELDVLEAGILAAVAREHGDRYGQGQHSFAPEEAASEVNRKSPLAKNPSKTGTGR